MGKPKLRVVGAAVMRDGRCLVAKRAPGRTDGGRWEFPGGKVEPGETRPQALVRELREELTVDVMIGAWLGQGLVERPQRQILLDVYAASILSGDPRALEHEALRWCAADELEGLDWADADKPVVAAVIARLLGVRGAS
ncbi:MAG: (deoxy)nucleoside triphosphate pyrophosphohydrolase [Myxococcota bacterium]